MTANGPESGVAGGVGKYNIVSITQDLRKKIQVEILHQNTRVFVATGRPPAMRSELRVTSCSKVLKVHAF